MSDDEHDSEKAAIENIPDGSEVSPEVEMLRAAVETMSERQKQVYELHYLRGFNVKETAAILGMSSPTVTAHKKRIVEEAEDLVSESPVILKLAKNNMLSNCGNYEKVF